jgi:hypothetical protein
MIRTILFSCLLTLCSATIANAQAANNKVAVPLPRVFQLGTNEQAYDALVQEYAPSLLEVCNNDMKVAFDKWLDMMKALEDYAKKINFDINGVKVRLHVFWDEEGNIDHIGYVFRTNSRNIRAEEFGALLSSFSRQYVFPVTSKQKFSHYTIATFPLFSQKNG